MQPIFAIVLAKFLLKETLPRRFGWLFVVALIGTYLLTFGFTLPLGNWNNWIHAGSLLSLGAAALWGGSTVMGRLMLGQTRYETVTSLRFVVALPLLIFMTWNEGAAWTLPSGAGEQAAVALNILGQALLPGLLSLLLYYKGLSSTKASVATLAELSFPMAGVLVNWIAFRTLITWSSCLDSFSSGLLCSLYPNSRNDLAQLQTQRLSFGQSNKDLIYILKALHILLDRQCLLSL